MCKGIGGSPGMFFFFSFCNVECVLEMVCHVRFQYGQPCCLTRSRHGGYVFKEAYPGLEDVAITWDLCVILFFLFLGICIFTALIIWNLLEMITTLRIDQQLTQTGYNQTNASLVNKSLNVEKSLE